MISYSATDENRLERCAHNSTEEALPRACVLRWREPIVLRPKRLIRLVGLRQSRHPVLEFSVIDPINLQRPKLSTMTLAQKLPLEYGALNMLYSKTPTPCCQRKRGRRRASLTGHRGQCAHSSALNGTISRIRIAVEEWAQQCPLELRLYPVNAAGQIRGEGGAFDAVSDADKKCAGTFSGVSRKLGSSGRFSQGVCLCATGATLALRLINSREPRQHCHPRLLRVKLTGALVWNERTQDACRNSSYDMVILLSKIRQTWFLKR